MHFKVIICDEAQYIKNPASVRAQAVLAMNSDYRIASTATPIENSISELWSILDYSNPGYLPSLKEFNKKYGERRVSDEVFKKIVEDLRTQLETIVLRRTKEDRLKDELPTKNVITQWCDIDEKQINLYRRICDDYGDNGSISNFLHHFQMLVMALTNPELLDGLYGIAFPTDYISPKLQKTLDLLHDIKRREEKTLIFADRKSVQSKLRDVIKAQYDIKPNVINGDTPDTLRRNYISRFGPDAGGESGFDVLILSPQCAGLGLNLVNANHVIHYLRSFNPAVENQATDRVYRIGQNRPVSVHVLVARTSDPELKFTVEQKLDDMIKRKQDLLKDYLFASRINRISEE
ncbi:MAG: DEAD/DEAH box helicase, partial [Nitrospirota bacterium]